MTARLRDNLGGEFPQQWIAAGWPLIFLAAIGFSIIGTFPVVGYRWTGELAAGVLILAGLAFFLFTRPERIGIGRSELYLVVLPLILFVAWSALSMTWASSPRAALHHTLLWGCYLTFYLLVRQTLVSSEARGNALKVTGAVIFAISAACLIDYIGYQRSVFQLFTARYYLYTEAFVAFIPVLAAVVIKADRKFSALALLVIAAIWTMTLATSSRAMFIGGIIGVVSFLAAAFYYALNELVVSRKLVAVGGVMALVPVFFLIPVFFMVPTVQGANVIERMSGNEEYSVTSARSRLLFWGLAMEGVKRSPVTGIGADNYFADYRNLREGFTEANPDSQAIAINENLLPERAHNEYLQILSELGIVGLLLFGWAIVGVLYLFIRTKSPSIYSIGAFAGVLVLLTTAAVSSYSFRFPTSGMAFFFLAAFAIPFEAAKKQFSARWIAAAALFPLMIIGFSTVRAASIYYFAQAASTQDREVAEGQMQKALWLDADEPMFRHYQGQMLNFWGRSEEAVGPLRFAIDNGLSTSTTYLTLGNTYVMLGRFEEADQTFREAVRVYPKSIFLRTAYSSFLKRAERRNDADAEYQIAEAIDAKQARSWQLAHDEGLERLAQTAYKDQAYLQAESLKPEGAAQVLGSTQLIARLREDPSCCLFTKQTP